MPESRLSIRIDTEIKEQAEEVLNRLGLTLSSGVNVFLKKVVAEQGLPFPVTTERSGPEGYKAVKLDTTNSYTLSEEQAEYAGGGKPVAKYNEAAGYPYLEYPDGRKEYNYEERGPVDETKKSSYGILKRYANPDLIEQEEGAWERAAAEKHALR